MMKEIKLKMKNMVLTSAIIIILIFSITDSTSWCTSPATLEGHTTNITCHFDSNIGDSKNDFQIDHYLVGSDTSSEMALLCDWNSGDMRCRTGDGYTFDYIVRDYVVLTVPRATIHHAGRYVCQVVPSIAGSHDPCLLYVLDIMNKVYHRIQHLALSCTIISMLKAAETGGTSTCQSPAILEGHTANITCHFDTNIGDMKVEFRIDHYREGSDSVSAVLTCDWFTGVLSCTIGDGYTFDNVIRDYVVLTVPSATKQYAGRYVCQVVPSVDGGHEPCVLYVLGADPPTTDNTALIVAIVFVIVFAIASLFLAIPWCRNAKIRAHIATFWNMRIRGRTSDIRSNYPSSLREAEFERNTPLLLTSNKEVKNALSCCECKSNGTSTPKRTRYMSV